MNKSLVSTAAVDGGKAVIYGLFIYKSHKAGDESSQAFLKDWLGGHASFEDCIGSYRAKLELDDGKEIYFSDNSGAMTWYYDERKGNFSSHLLDVVPDAERKPNYEAVAEFLNLGWVYGVETMIHGIRRSNPNCYYEVRPAIGGDDRSEDVVTERGKGLAPLAELPCDDEVLGHLVERVLAAVGPETRMACSITGGVDSRAVLAHLLARGSHPLLTLAGDESLPDVRIARQIASLVGEDIHVAPGQPASDWIEDGLRAADGSSSVFNWRLNNWSKSLSNKEIKVVWGGVLENCTRIAS